MASVDARFQAAVELIENLPENMSFSYNSTSYNNKMLKLYGLYRHGKCGKCEEARPAFWDVVKLAKWNSWRSQRSLTQHQAKVRYLAELKKFIKSVATTPKLIDLIKVFANTSGTVDFAKLEFIVPGVCAIVEKYLDPEVLTLLKGGQNGGLGSSRNSAAAALHQDSSSPSPSSSSW